MPEDGERMATPEAEQIACFLEKTSIVKEKQTQLELSRNANMSGQGLN